MVYKTWSFPIELNKVSSGLQYPLRYIANNTFTQETVLCIGTISKKIPIDVLKQVAGLKYVYPICLKTGLFE